MTSPAYPVPVKRFGNNANRSLVGFNLPTQRQDVGALNPRGKIVLSNASSAFGVLATQYGQYGCFMGLDANGVPKISAVGANGSFTFDGKNVAISGSITATSGTITGDLQIGTGGDFRSGQTAFNTGTGFWMDYNGGSPRISVGNPAGSHWTWNNADGAFKIYNAAGLLIFDSNTLNSSGLSTALIGKNAIANPGFEQNLAGVALNTDVAAGNPLIDGWIVASDGTDLFDVTITTTTARSGTHALAVNLRQNISVPASTTIQGYAACQHLLPVRIGDTIQFGGYAFWWQDGIGALPAGVTATVDVTLNIYDSSGTLITSINSFGAITSNNGASYLYQSASYTIPASISGHIPAFVNLEPGVSLTNSNVTAFNTGAHSYLLAQFDDVFLTSNDNVVCLGFNGLTMSYTSTPTSITITWTAGTLYFSDGTTISVPASTGGTQYTVTGLVASTTYYFYMYIQNTVAQAVSSAGGGANLAPSASALASQSSGLNTPLKGTWAITTPASGTGGGGGGLGGCLHESTTIRIRRKGEVLGVYAGDVQVGDELLTDKDWQPVLKVETEEQEEWISVGADRTENLEPTLHTLVTPTQPFYRLDGSMVRAKDLTAGMIVKAEGGPVEICMLNMRKRQPANKVILRIPAPHLFYLEEGSFWMHNGNPKP